MTDRDEFDQRDAFLLALLGLVALADETLGAGSGAGPPPEGPPAEPAPPRDETPILR